MFFCKICGITLKIVNHYDYIRELCRDYIVGEAVPDFVIAPTSEQIRREYEADTAHRPEYYAESLAVLRALSNLLLDLDGFVFHSAAAALDGRGYIFAGRSGAGKSTHAMLWEKHLDGRAEIICGDKPIIRLEDGAFYVYGTPWSGTEGRQKNTAVPVEAVCFIKQSGENKIRRMTAAEAAVGVLGQTVRFPESAKQIKLMDLLDKFVSEIPFYELECNISEAAVECAYAAMAGGKKRSTDMKG